MTEIEVLKELGTAAVGGTASITTILLLKMMWDKKKDDPVEKVSARLEKEVEKLATVTTDHKILLTEFKSIVSEFKTVMQAQTQVLQALVSKITNS